jgi:hypothetical protein
MTRTPLSGSIFRKANFFSRLIKLAALPALRPPPRELMAVDNSNDSCREFFAIGGAALRALCRNGFYDRLGLSFFIAHK